MNLAYTPSTICAVATAPGRGGVGVVRISGRALLPLAQALSGGKTPKPRYATYTDFVAADGTPIQTASPFETFTGGVRVAVGRTPERQHDGRVPGLASVPDP